MTIVHLTIGPQGRIVIPAKLRRELHWEPGTAVSAEVDEAGRLVLTDRDAALRRLRGILKGHGSVDEFIAERRAEAARE